MKHPINRRVFFTRQRNDFLSLNEVHTLARSGKLALSDFVFDVDGGSYTAESIAQGKAPKWAMTAEHDLMLHDCPPLSEEDIALANELACEDDFLEMPEEPKSKTVSHYLATEPRIARFVADAEHCLF
jgi:hypothetical protein